MREFNLRHHFGVLCYIDYLLSHQAVHCWFDYGFAGWMLELNRQQVSHVLCNKDNFKGYNITSQQNTSRKDAHWIIFTFYYFHLYLHVSPSEVDIWFTSIQHQSSKLQRNIFLTIKTKKLETDVQDSIGYLGKVEGKVSPKKIIWKASIRRKLYLKY